MQFEHFLVQRQMRYTVFPETPTKGNTLVIALHGYGQLTEFFSKKFQELGNEFVVICPEGMHRFYLEGTSGRVGASWMTKEWREQDIIENINALNGLVESIVKQLEPVKIIVVGFSQGVATAARWIQNSVVKIDKFIAWAGVFPPDLEISLNCNLPEHKIAVIGTNDPYFNGSIAEEMITKYTELGFEIRQFEGKHELNQELLYTICN